MPAETGTHFFRAIAASNPGQVDVAYLGTSAMIPTDALRKANAGGCAGRGPANGNLLDFISEDLDPQGSVQEEVKNFELIRKDSSRGHYDSGTPLKERGFRRQKGV